MADSSNDTVINGLKKLFPQVSALLLAQDAQQHAQFIQGLMGAIQKYLTTAAQSTIQGGGGPQAAPGQPPGGGASPTPGGGPAPDQSASGPLPAMQNAAGGGGGFTGLAGAVSRNPDELRRLLTQTANP